MIEGPARRTSSSAAAAARGVLRPVAGRPVGDRARDAEPRPGGGLSRAAGADLLTPPAAVRRAPAGVEAHARFRHEAVLHRGGTALVAHAARFLTDGVSAGQAVMVQAPASVLKRLAPALGAEAQGVQLVDTDELGSNPARSTDVWLGFAAAGRPARGLAVPAWHARRPALLAEQQLADALLCAAVDPDAPLWLRCAYDLERMDSPTLRHVGCTHPHLVLGPLRRPSRRYAGLTHLQALFEQRLPAPAAPGLRFTITRTADLATVRKRVHAHAAAAGLSVDVTEGLTLAVHELAVDALLYGGGCGTLLLGRERTALVCEVNDRDHLSVPFIGQRQPDCEPTRGRGLWLANQLCDLVQVRSGSWGTAARITTWL